MSLSTTSTRMVGTNEGLHPTLKEPVDDDPCFTSLLLLFYLNSVFQWTCN